MLILLLAATLLWLALPLVPALLELRNRRDARPLKIAARYTHDIPATADVFSQDVYGFLHRLIEGPRWVMTRGNSGLDKSGRFKVIRDPRQFADASMVPANVHKIVVCEKPLDLRRPVKMDGCIYAGTPFLCGAGSVIESVYGERDVYFGPRSEMRRWTSARGFVVADSDCLLAGSVRSEVQIMVRPGCLFERLSAPSIAFGWRRSGPGVREDMASRDHASGLRLVAEPSLRADRSVVAGDLVLSSDVSYEGNLVVEGQLLVRQGASVRGNIKCLGRLTIEEGAWIHGHVFAGTSATVGRDVHIDGVINVEGDLELRSGSVIGSASCLSTVAAARLRVEEGVHVSGTVWALEQGTVVPAAPRLVAIAA